METVPLGLRTASISVDPSMRPSMGLAGEYARRRDDVGAVTMRNCVELPALHAITEGSPAATRGLKYCATGFAGATSKSSISDRSRVTNAALIDVRVALWYAAHSLSKATIQRVPVHPTSTSSCAQELADGIITPLPSSTI